MRRAFDRGFQVTVSAIKSSLAAREAAQLLHADANYVVATWERHVIVIWRSEISVHGVATWSRAMAELKQQHGGKPINVFVYIEPECHFTGSPTTFEACVDALKRFQDVVAGTSIVYEREGFWNAAMRGRVTAIHNESKAEVPYALHPSVDQALAWLTEHGADDLDLPTGALAAQLHALRRT